MVHKKTNGIILWTDFQTCCCTSCPDRPPPCSLGGGDTPAAGKWNTPPPLVRTARRCPPGWRWRKSPPPPSPKQKLKMCKLMRVTFLCAVLQHSKSQGQIPKSDYIGRNFTKLDVLLKGGVFVFRNNVFAAATC